jgi:hypothetical protein
MPILVHDSLGAVEYAHGTVLGSPRWGAVAGKPLPYIGRTYDSMALGASCEYRSAPDIQYAAPAAAHWAAHGFHPDQFAEASHGPFAWGSFRQTAGLTVRQDPGSDTCYVAYLIYSADEGGTNGPELRVYRVRNGVQTMIGALLLPMFAHSDDWWFFQLQAWGQSPVHLRAITKAPTQYVLDGHTPADIPDFADARYLHDGQTFRHDPSAPGPFPGYHMLPYDLSPLYVAPPNDGAVLAAAAGAITNPGRAWIVWEGTDASADRILSGQPGMRWGTKQNQLAKFTAGTLAGFAFYVDPPATPQDGAVTIAGSRLDGTTITVSCSTATVGAVTYPTATTWEATVSDLGPGTNTITASDGTTSDAVDVQIAPPVTEIAPPAAALAISAAVPSVRALAAVPSVTVPAAWLALRAGTPTVRALDLSRLTAPSVALVLRAAAPNLSLGRASWRTPAGATLPFLVFDGGSFRAATPRLFNGSNWN